MADPAPTALASAVAARFPGARLRGATTGGDVLVFPIDGVWLDARFRTSPFSEIYIGCRGLGGFTLDIVYDDQLIVTSNDRALAAAWRDHATDAAILALRGWRCAIADDTVTVLRGAWEHDADRFATALRAAATVATFPHRLAASWVLVARALGGACTTDRWDLGGEFAVVVDRRGCAVRIDPLRVLPDEDTRRGRLRTRVTTRRTTTRGDRLALVRRDLAGRGQPTVSPSLREAFPEHARLVARYDVRTSDIEALLGRLHSAISDLVVATDAAAITVSADAVTVLFEGLELDHRVLQPAVELCARLAVDDASAAAGPYR